MYRTVREGFRTPFRRSAVTLTYAVLYFLYESNLMAGTTFSRFVGCSTVLLGYVRLAFKCSLSNREGINMENPKSNQIQKYPRDIRIAKYAQSELE
jgi:hypothetical protein